MVKIYTLGDFDIRINDVSILESIGNQPKLMKLFKYFLTFQGKKLLPENIIDDLWDGEYFRDPLNVLRTQISRVRKMIDVEEYNIEAFFKINYINGYYIFRLKNSCSVDFVQLEACIDKSDKIKDEDEIIEVCKQSVKLYKGEYLGELGNEEWVMPFRNRIDRLYINSLVKYLQLLKEKSMDNHVISICEDFIVFKPYEEIIHIYLIESLINLGQNRCALTHYRYYTSKVYGLFREPPSNKMKILYKKIKSNEDKMSSNISLDTLDSELKDIGEAKGALICDNYYFKFIYNLELRHNDRSIENVFAGILTIDQAGYGQLSLEDLKDAMNLLLDIIYYNLRKSDVITKWSESQVLILLYSVEEKFVGRVIKRIEDGFKKHVKDDNIILKVKFKII